jgi:hypothetical protein
MIEKDLLEVWKDGTTVSKVVGTDRQEAPLLVARFNQFEESLIL